MEPGVAMIGKLACRQRAGDPNCNAHFFLGSRIHNCEVMLIFPVTLKTGRNASCPQHLKSLLRLYALHLPPPITPLLLRTSIQP